jgi:hypothetical protein
MQKDTGICDLCFVKTSKSYFLLLRPQAITLRLQRKQMVTNLCIYVFMLAFTLVLDARDKNKIELYLDKKSGYEYEPPGGISISVNSYFSFVNFTQRTGMLDIKFPYQTINPATNAVTTGTFTASKNDLTGVGKWVYPGVGLEIGYDNFSAEASIGWYFDNWSDYIYFGASYRFILRGLYKDPERYTFGATTLPGKKNLFWLGDFPVKLSCGFFYWQPIWKLGEIEVGNKEFVALGERMQRRDTLQYGTSGRVIVLYHQNIIALTPNITFGYQPQDGMLDISFRIAPLIVLGERGGLRFHLKNSTNVEWQPENGISLNSVIALNQPGLIATYNGEAITATPYRIRGVMYTLRIGIRLIHG